MLGDVGVDVPLRFVDKQTFAVSIADAFFGGDDILSLPFTYCEVYAPVGRVTNVRANDTCP